MSLDGLYLSEQLGQKKKKRKHTKILKELELENLLK